jgi:hypothetical protein
VFSSWNLNIDTATDLAVGSRLFVYVRKSNGPSLEPCLAGCEFDKVYMCIVYWTVYLVDQHIIMYY